jgi:hypothetical protein
MPPPIDDASSRPLGPASESVRVSVLLAKSKVFWISENARSPASTAPCRW